MLQKTQAVASLQEGCRRLGLPNSTAAALLQFLSVKRIHDQFVPEKDRQLRMSPGATLDKLWHYMLLNTSVSTCVHGLLGGVVDHRGTDAWDLADDTKLLQRLYALNVLRLEGHEPDTELWKESGTAAHALRLTTSPVPGLQSLPGGGRLYVTPSLTQQQLSQLAQALQALYAHDTQQFSTPEALHGPAAASTASVAAAAAGCGRQPAAKRPRVEQQRQQEQQSLSSGASKLTLILICQLGSQVHMSVKPSTQLHKVFNAYAECKLVPPQELRFMYKGNRVHGNSNPLELGMVTGDVIECRLQQAGC